MELAEATVRSLRRGRTVDLHYEPISEESNFKSVMTSTGCMILIGALFAVLFALSGPPLGYNWTIYIAYLIPPILVIFVVLQTLRFAVRKPVSRKRPYGEPRRRTRMTARSWELIGSHDIAPDPRPDRPYPRSALAVATTR